MSDSPPFVRLHSRTMRPIQRALLFLERAGIRGDDTRRTQTMGVRRQSCHRIAVIKRKQETASDGGAVVETAQPEGIIPSNFEYLISTGSPNVDLSNRPM